MLRQQRARAVDARQQAGRELAALERALVLAGPEGYVRIFVDEGEPMRLMIADLRLRIEKQKCDQDHKLTGYADQQWLSL